MFIGVLILGSKMYAKSNAVKDPSKGLIIIHTYGNIQRRNTFKKSGSTFK
jgi:hypothetical protein